MEELTIEVILHACMIDMHPDKISGGLLAEGCEENGYMVLPVFNKHVTAL